MKSDNDSYKRCFFLMLSSIIYSLAMAASGIFGLIFDIYRTLLVYINPQPGIPQTDPLIHVGVVWRILELYLVIFQSRFKVNFSLFSVKMQ